MNLYGIMLKEEMLPVIVRWLMYKQMLGDQVGVGISSIERARDGYL
jgi:hypothetical protein